MSPGARIHPEGMAQSCLTASCASFVASCGQRPLLLIEVGDALELLPALYISYTKSLRGGDLTDSSDRLGHTPRLGYTTLSQEDLGYEARASGEDEDEMEALARLLASVSFAFPLERAANRYIGMSFTLGRDLKNDIVVRHPSVSKFHAWFAVDGTHGVRLNASRTTNGSYANGALVEGDFSQPVCPGAELRFGAIRARVVDPALYFSAVRRRS